MPIENPNRSPRSVNYTGPAIKNGLKQPFSVIDIGASGGLDPVMAPLIPFGNFVGFEPDKKECENLNAKYKEIGDIQFYPVAIGDKIGTHKFYISKSSPIADSLLPPNPDFWNRYPNLAEVETVGQTTIETQTLDQFIHKNNIPFVDFIKLDIEGAELQVLENARNTLKNKNVLGLITEYIWEPDVRIGQRGLGELDNFLRNQGLFMFDLQCWRFPRATLPVGHIYTSRIDPNDRTLTQPPRYTRYGQVITGNALYFRDPIKSAQLGTNQIEWNEAMVLKLVTILDIYNYQDYAIELINHFRPLFKHVDPDDLKNHLTPPLGNSTVCYNHYFELSRLLYEQGITEQAKVHLAKAANS